VSHFVSGLFGIVLENRVFKAKKSFLEKNFISKFFLKVRFNNFYSKKVKEILLEFFIKQPNFLFGTTF
jgi:hypothetical protein